MAKPSFHFITLFPDAIRVWLTTSILGRAHEAGLFNFEIVQLRDFAHDRHRSVDDVAYGGGGGMVLRVEPLVEAVESLFEKHGRPQCRTIYFSPAGKPLSQSLLEAHGAESEPDHFVLICGHYEGVDQRFLDHWVDDEISLGDFVLTGGELPAVAYADALIRRVEGSLGHEDAYRKESFTLRDPASGRPLLEYPHYTRPAQFRGHDVPEVLLSGNHQLVEKWRMEKAREKTLSSRPELLS